MDADGRLTPAGHQILVFTEDQFLEIAGMLAGGRLAIADILVQKPVKEAAKQKIDLWTG